MSSGGRNRERLDYVIPLNASHLRRILREWANHYNAGRPHRTLGPGIPDQSPQTPVSREPTSYPRQASHVISKSILGGLHHEYRWTNAA